PVNASHEFTIGARIIGRPTPSLRRKEVTSAKFGAVIWLRFGHRSASSHSVCAISKACEIKLGIVVWCIKHRRTRDKWNSRAKHQHAQNRNDDYPHSCCRLISTAAAGPRRIQVINDSGPHHFDAPDPAILDEESFRHKYARRPVESPELIWTAIRKN